MESIIATCERSGHFIEGNKAAGEVVKSLKLRLSDTQVSKHKDECNTLSPLVGWLDGWMVDLLW